MSKWEDAPDNQASEDTKSFILTDWEFNYLKVLNEVLRFNTHQQQLTSGFMFYLSTERLGYPKDANLQFQIDLDDPKKELHVTVFEPNSTPVDNK